jgi:NAD(P)-dependent dehydrogenase (short-subunit alcohol dehydrogenase family)
MALDFKEQVVLVTGAGRGLGRLSALEFARRGASVVVNNDGATPVREGSPPVAQQVVDEIEAAGGRAVSSFESVATVEGGQAIVNRALDEFGRLDVVVSNAGIYQTEKFEDIDPQDWRRVLDINLDGAFYVSQPAFRVMKARGYGRFVFMSSSMGVFGAHEAARYASSKAGLIGMANVIALEGAEHGITANCVLPFGTTRLAGDEHNASKFVEAQRPELVIPLVMLLASRECDVSRQVYSACAGRYARAFVGLTEGWLAPEREAVTVEDLQEHFDEIGDLTTFTVPSSIMDEVRDVCVRLGIV